MRAIKGNAADGDKKDASKEAPEKEMDPLDFDEEEESSEADKNKVSSKSRIKSIVSSKALIMVGMFLVVTWMIYSSFFAKRPVELDADGNPIVKDDDEEDRNTPFSKRELKKSGVGGVISKDEDKNNPFKKMSDKGKGVFGDGVALDDPDLPPLDLAKDASYVDPMAPAGSVVDAKAGNRGGDSNASATPPADAKPLTPIEKEQMVAQKMGAEGIIPPPKWINLMDSQVQVNPSNGLEKYDPSTGVLYKGDEKYLVSQAVQAPTPIAPVDSLDLGSLSLDQNKGGKGLIGAAIPGSPDGPVGPIADSVGGQITDERKLSMFVMQGSPPQNSNRNKKEKKDFLIMDESLISERKSDASKGSVKRLSNLDTSVLTGKIIDAVLETAINTEVPGNSRAIVSHDVYGETGEKVLIPKGSRMYGTYSSKVSRGQSTVQISWSRIVRPDGVDVTISAQAVDQFGRSGVRGDVDNRIGDSIANSILMTMTTLGAGLLAQQLGTGTGQSQVVNPNGTFTTTNITPLNYAAQAAIQTATDMVSGLTEGSKTMSPIITLPQGTKIKIIMDQDVRLPAFKKIVLP